ncbi:MAG TPA: hypothetical protein PLU72_15170 [Candidatus Ozemobacteraceae bacterium]|nr:hypothetical protein [Candidatus Ozemobacteraceae bacterium]HQG27330.1 hypothetical protein [Candidatus Ozemobacteraceae bacterium]
MNSQFRVSGLLLAGFLTLAAGTPASALTEDGKNLLERIRSRIEAKEAAAAAPVETVAPPAEFETQTPPAQEFEPGSIVTEPEQDEKQKAPAKKPRKPAVPRSEHKNEASASEKTDRGTRKEASKPLFPPADLPVAPTASAAIAAPATADTPQATANAPAGAGSGRSFGELSDAELIQYAQDHMWSQEKSRKHNPPWTPPSKPKKKKDEKQKADTTSAKSDAKKAGSAQTKKSAAKGKS